MCYSENGKTSQLFVYTEWTPDKFDISAGKTNLGPT